MTRRFLVVAALLAVLAGIVGGFALARASRDAPAATARRLGAGFMPATTSIPLGPTTVLHVARAAGTHADVLLRPHGPVRIEARSKDPLGGPDWAVRVFDADRVTRPGIRRPGVDPIVGRDLCVQLGRVHAGRFGWLDADGTFRPLRLEIGGTMWCGSRRPDLHREPHLDTVTTITDPDQPAARVKSTIVWGVAGRAARSVELTLHGRPVTPPASPHGAFLVVAGGELRQTTVRAVVRYPDGRPVSLPQSLPGPFGVRWAAQFRLAGRAPDPNGGLPFALLATRTPDGGWCTMTGPRMVGDRVGSVDYRLDVLREVQAAGGGGCALPGSSMFRRHPVLLTSTGGTGARLWEGADPARPGRVMRRTQPGTTSFGGIAAPDVVAVTLKTPRDIRTLVPTGPAHAIIAVYDGSFPAGELVITARFRDGHTKTESLGDMGF